MREIKFRAKSLNGDLEYFQLFEVTNYFPSDGVFYVDSVPCKVGSEQQYTGLKDKNGKEIYEGDILELNKEEYYKVVWVDKEAGFAVECDDGMVIGGALEGGDYFEVIGNIYENKELLEG